MRILLLAALVSMSGCFAWAFVDSQNDAARARNDAPRCAAYCKSQGAQTSFELTSTRQCGCQYDDGHFTYSDWPN